MIAGGGDLHRLLLVLAIFCLPGSITAQADTSLVDRLFRGIHISLEFRQVKDSGGHPEDRPFIRTKAKIGEHVWEIDMSLTNRENMKFRMLLGREALAGQFVVDPSSSYLIGKSLFHEYKS